MPSIVGLVTAEPRSRAERRLRKMLNAVAHEEFYSQGTFVDESLGIYVGWTALKGSFSDGMPLRNENSGTCLIFSGEDYSDTAVRQEWQRCPSSSSALESGYLLKMYEKDQQFVVSLNGMFHGLIVDRSQNSVTLFNDRYGMHRLYYHVGKDEFCFAGEAKAILAIRPDLRVADSRGLGEFVACSCVLENRTIFKDIYVLPAGSMWTFRGTRCETKQTYFRPSEWEEAPTLDPEGYYQQLRATVSNMLPRYFSGRQQLGIAMTGGLDTRVILASHATAPGSLPSYTFSGPIRDSYDVRVGRRIAGILDQPYQTIEVGKEFLNGFARYAERSIWLTEGTVDVYRASDLYVSSKARQIAPAKIVGTYGSEIVCHAVMFKAVEPIPGLFMEEFLKDILVAGETYTALRKQHPVTFAAFSQSPWYHHGILALEQSQLTVRSPFMDNEFVRMVYLAPRSNGSGADVRLRLIRDGNPELGRIGSDRGVGGSLLSRGFREFTFKAEYACDYGMPQWAAQINNWLTPLHPDRIFLGRHKFLHYRLWYREALAGYVQEILLDPRTLSRPFLNRRYVEEMVKGHVQGNRNSTTAIHKMLTMELLFRKFFDAQSSDSSETVLDNAIQVS
jgi:asparagine synthase (glutamine-hydrolysing)